MKHKHTLLTLSTISIIGLLLLSTLAACQPKTDEPVIHQAKLVITPDDMDPVEQQIAEAFEQSITGREDILSFLIYNVNIDNIQLNAKKNRALIWISLSDPLTGDMIPAETGLALAEKQKGVKEGNPWKITLQADEDWMAVLQSFPEKLIDADTKEQYSNRQQSIPHAGKVYTGYRLPWATGEAKRLSGSVGHVYLYKSCPTTCLYAFDFYDGTMWDILAAKGGRVKYAVWQYPNGNTKHANYIVLEDTSTNPTTYQVYLHLAQDSIPVALRTPGAKVVQGQKIGVVDDTGYSTGHHLHFMVHTTSNYYWGTSVDIVFDEVKINGGRPRTCNESRLFPSLGRECQKNDTFVSKNNDYENPVGKITSPADKSVISSQSFVVKGKATDDSGIQSLQVLLSTDGVNWITAADVDVKTLNNKGEFSASVDLCALEVPNGDFLMALNVTDKASKTAAGTPGLRTLTKRFDCPLPEPKCNASGTQVGLFEKAEFQGNCVLLDPGSYETNGDLLSQISGLGSIQIGSDVYAQLFSSAGQTALAADALNLDGLGITYAELQTVVVAARPAAPQPQTILIEDQNTADGLSSGDTINVTWEILDPSHEYLITLYQSDKVLQRQDWTTLNQWELAGLEAGTYKIVMETRNVSGSALSEAEFIVKLPDIAPATLLNDLPEYSDSTSFQIGWTVQDGFEDLQHVEIRYTENGGDWQFYKSFPPQITSVLFAGNTGAVYQFEIRGVDLAGNAEAFHGGAADTVTVTAQCTPDEYDLTAEGDGAFTLATALVNNTAQKHNLCPKADRDFYSFTAKQGDAYRISINPLAGSGGLEMVLYHGNTTDVLAEAIPNANSADASIAWTAPASGTYYLEVAAAQPDLYGDQTLYHIKLQKQTQLSSPGLVIPAALVPLFLTFLAASRRIFRLAKNKQQ